MNRPLSLADRERIKQTAGTTPQQRLIWLEEANEFVEKVARSKRK